MFSVCFRSEKGRHSVGDSAFSYCTSLTSITIPDSVTSIGDWAFSACRSLTTVYYGGTEEQWNNVSIGSGNDYLTNAEIIFLGEPEIPEFIPGDLDGNGVINGRDSFMICCFLSGKSAVEEGSSAFLAADLDGDGSITGKDAFNLICIISGSVAA